MLDKEFFENIEDKVVKNIKGTFCQDFIDNFICNDIVVRNICAFVVLIIQLLILYLCYMSFKSFIYEGNSDLNNTIFIFNTTATCIVLLYHLFLGSYHLYGYIETIVLSIFNKVSTNYKDVRFNGVSSGYCKEVMTWLYCLVCIILYITNASLLQYAIVYTVIGVNHDFIKNLVRKFTFDVIK